MSLKRKILLLFLVVSLSPVLFMGWVGLTSIYDLLHENLTRSELKEVEHMSYELNQLIEFRIAQAKLISYMPELIEQVKLTKKVIAVQRSLNPKELNQLDRAWVKDKHNHPLAQKLLKNKISGLLRQMSQEPTSDFGEIFVTDEKGLTLGMTKTLTDFYQADEGWWQGAWNEGKGNVFLDDRGWDLSIGSLALGVVLPIYDQGDGSSLNSKPIGIIKINFKINEIFQKLSKRVRKDHTPFLVRSNGSLLIGQIEGRKDYNIPFETLIKADEDIGHFEMQYEGETLEIYFANLAYKINQRVINKEIARGITGESWEAVHWVYFDVVNSAVLDRKIIQTGITLSIGLVGLLVTLVIASFWLRTFIEKPIEIIHKGVMRVASGDYSTRIEEPSERELKLIAQSFNKMTAHVEKGQQWLEKEVADRLSQINQNEVKLRALFNAISESVLIMNVSGKAYIINETGARRLGSTPEKIMGANLYSMIPKDVAERRIEAVRKAVETNRPLHFIDERGGRIFEQTIYPIAGEGNLDERQVAVFAIDITEKKEAEEKIAMAMENLKIANEELSQFAYIASHDLQEPVRKIIGFGERLVEILGDDLNDKARDYLERMTSAGYRMSQLIADLLQLSRVVTKARPFVALDLNQITKNVLDDLSIPIEEANAQISVEQLPSIEGDQTQMGQLFQNLIGNSLKYRKSMGPCEISISTKNDGDFLKILFKDNGIGFEQKYVDKIFGVFQRLHGKNEYSGTGIGLAIVKKIVERHHGSIEVESLVDEGSSFLIALPFKQISQEDNKNA